MEHLNVKGLVDEDNDDVTELKNTIVEKILKEHSAVEPCGTCGGSKVKRTASGYVPCPECQNPLNTIREARSIPEESISFIPPDFKGYIAPQNEWEDMTMMSSSANKQQTIEALNDWFISALNGNVPNYSYYLAYPGNLSYLSWAYTVLQLALAKQKTVVPILDSYELDTLDKHNLYQLEDHHLLQTSMTKVYLADFCIIHMRTGKLQKREVQLVRAIIDARALKGKPTFVLSNFPVMYFNNPDLLSFTEKLVQTKRSRQKDKLLYLELTDNYQPKITVKSNSTRTSDYQVTSKQNDPETIDQPTNNGLSQAKRYNKVETQEYTEKVDNLIPSHLRTQGDTPPTWPTEKKQEKVQNTRDISTRKATLGNLDLDIEILDK